MHYALIKPFFFLYQSDFEKDGDSNRQGKPLLQFLFSFSLNHFSISDSISVRYALKLSDRAWQKKRVY